MTRPSGFDDVNPIGTIYFNACSPVEPAGINIHLDECWDDSTPRRLIVLTCNAAVNATQFSLQVEEAEALGLLLIGAAREMRRIGDKLDDDDA